MKHLLIALIAIIMTLGVACKKSESHKQEAKKELTIKRLADAPAESGIGGYPGGAATYPHNTGLCYCGAYSVRHPTRTITHRPDCPGGNAASSGLCNCPVY